MLVFRNAPKDRTQGGHILAAVHKNIGVGENAAWSPLYWKSGHLKRATESTLSGETQSWSRGFKDLEWVLTLWTEMLSGEPVNVSEREKVLWHYKAGGLIKANP